MNEKQRNALSQELVELFDIKKNKLRSEEKLNQEASEAQKDIRLLTLMFKEGIPDMSMKISEDESIVWDSKAQKILYQKGSSPLIIDATSRETRIRIRPYLIELVKKAKDFYNDDGPASTC